MKIAIHGAGVAGLALALELQERGADVTVLERAGDQSRSASWLAGGMLAPWCERENAEDEVLVYGKESIAWWDRALPGHVARQGTLVVAQPRDLSELDRFASRTSGFQRVDGAGISALEQDLGGRFSKGLFFSGEAHLEPRKALVALRAKLEASGVRFEFGSEPDQSTEVDLVAACTGNAATDPELRPVRGEMLLLHAPDVSLARPVRLLHPRIPVYVVPRDGHRYMVGATMIESGDDGPVSVRSTMELLNAAYSLHPGFAEAKIVETGAGLRPAYPDNLPRVSLSGNTLTLNGFYRHGFLLAPHYAGVAAKTIIRHLQEKSLEAHH